MKSSVENKVAGAARQAKGAVKEAAGKVTNNKSLQAKGAVEKASGKAERKLGDIKKVVGR